MRIHVFVDAENITGALFFEACSALKQEHEMIYVDIFGKTAPPWAAGYRFTPCFIGKNSADMFMTTAMVRAVYEEPLVEGFAVFSHDRDFIPAIKAVTDAKKYLILITVHTVMTKHLERIGVDMRYFESMEFPAYPAYKRIDLSAVERARTAQYQMTTCFIQTKTTLFEVPFANGIDMHTFCRILPLREIRKDYGKSKSMTKILQQNCLKVVDNKVYIDEETL